MALFVGRIPRTMGVRELEDVFTKYGKINRLNVKTDFGFVEFEDKRHAEEALEGMAGNELIVEWAKNNGRRTNESECFNCGKDGHWAKDCREKLRDGNKFGRPRARSPRRDFGGRDRRTNDRGYERRGYRDNRDRSPRRDDYRNGDKNGDRQERRERGLRRDDREKSPNRERRTREA